jgi:hypothetical protein
LLRSRAERQFERRYPLQLAICKACLLLQVTETVPPSILYQDEYPYFSSSSPALVAHAKAIAQKLIAERGLGPESYVIEVGSNDGYLLRNFLEDRIPCLGVDPAEGPSREATDIGLSIINDFFSLTLANRLAREGRLADLIIANNVIAHVDEINDFVAGFACLLKPTGLAVCEFAYAVDMIENCEFDTIYHEHLFYHTLHGLTPLFGRHGLSIVDAERLPIHGGSLRIYVARDPGQSERLKGLIDAERSLGADTLEWYRGFADRVADLKSCLIRLLKQEKDRGSRIACYGAAAKGSTLVNYLNLGPDFFEFVADANRHKQGRYMPGQLIPIVHPDRLLETLPDLVLLLVWNFAGEVLRQQAAYRSAGGRFLIPIPAPHLVEPLDIVEDTAFAVAAVRPEAQEREQVALAV